MGPRAQIKLDVGGQEILARILRVSVQRQPDGRWRATLAYKRDDNHRVGYTHVTASRAALAAQALADELRSATPELEDLPF